MEKSLGGPSPTAVDTAEPVVPAPELSHDARKHLYVFGPSNEPDTPDCCYGRAEDLSGLIEQLRHYLPQMDEDDQFVVRVKRMTDAEAEALPDV